MSIVIDRFTQVIINQGGKAHFTGWHVPRIGQIGPKQLYLQRGKSGWKGGVFWFQPEGPIVPYDGKLTKELFVQLTGWTPE